jgi:hypothetical protein
MKIVFSPLWLSFLLGISLLIGACGQEPCAEVECLNGGTCLEGTCDCPEGFTGPSCESFESSEFLGSYTASYGDCFDVSDDHRVDVDLNPNNDTTSQLLLYNLGDYACPNGELAVAASVNLNQIVIPDQTIDCGGIEYTFSGSGELQGNRLIITFTNRYDAGGIMRDDQCTATLEKRP